MSINRENTVVRNSWDFKPFAVPDEGIPLGRAGLSDDHELIVLERKGVYRALSMLEMAYLHVAQGRLNGEPYLVCF